MEDETLKGKDTELSEKAYRLLSLGKRGEDITVRDDQYEFPWLLDSVRLCRQRGARFRLVDSGKLDRFQLEWLGRAGADIYTSDETRTDAVELEMVNEACKKGRAIIAYFLKGSLEPEESGKDTNSVSFSELENMARSGICFYLTNRERTYPFSRLGELAYACKRGGGCFVYYHNGPLDASFEELGGSRAWIHITDQSLQKAENGYSPLDSVRSMLSNEIRLVLHLEKGVEFSLLLEIIRAGAYILFKSSLFDYKSPFRSLEREAKKRKLDFRAYYLYPTFLL